MNAERAFEQHTDLIRALDRPGSPERARLDAYHRQLGGKNPVTGDPQEFVSIGDLGYLALQASKSMTTKARFFMGFTPESAPQSTPEPVGVVDPERIGGQPADDEDPEVLAFLPNVLSDLAVATMKVAPTIYITADMVTVLEHAASALDDTDLMPFDADYPTGFAVLGRPLRLPYGDGTEQVIHAFAWGSWPSVRTVLGGTGRAGYIWQFANRQEAPDDRGVRAAQRFYPSRRAADEAPDLVLSVADAFVTNSPVGRVLQTSDEIEDYTHRLRAALDDLSGTDISYAVPVSEQSTESETYGRAQPFLAALLLLLSQEITVQRSETVSDYAHKRARRVGRPTSTASSPEAVTIIDLAPRRHNDQDHETEGLGHRLTERHLVGGHWKWQPYGPQRRLRRRIYVADYVRGPDDAPLVVKPRVRRL